MTYNLPDTSYRTQIFYQSGQWIKPQGITMIYITAIGAGSGGGGGASAASGVIALGGGGGGSGCITRLMIPADLVQDTLRVTVGLGSAGAAAGGTAAAGGNTTVDGIPSSLSTLVFSNGAGTGGTPGSGGGGGSPMTLQGGNLAGVGVFVSSGGATGGGGTIPSQTNITYGTLPITGPLPITAGAAGGYKDASNNSFSGGSIVGAGVVPTYSGGTAGGGNGIDCQISTLAPFIQIGGSGGGGNANGTGGRGGDGGIGCGGGGGGGGITGGAGGKGGNGLVIINCW